MKTICFVMDEGFIELKNLQQESAWMPPLQALAFHTHQENHEHRIFQCCYTFHWLFRQFRHFKFFTPFLASVEGKPHKIQKAHTKLYVEQIQLCGCFFYAFTCTFPRIKSFNGSKFKTFQHILQLKEQKL